MLCVVGLNFFGGFGGEKTFDCFLKIFYFFLALTINLSKHNVDSTD